MPTLLIVDDEPAVRRLLQTCLGDLGTILEAANGLTALEVLANEHVDLMVLDWMMPLLDGLQVIDRVRADPQHDGLPILMLTAKDDPISEYRARRAGADGYVVKPFDPDLFEALVHVMLVEATSGRVTGGDAASCPRGAVAVPDAGTPDRDRADADAP